MKKDIKFAKFITIISFLTLLFSTYYLRSQVLKLNSIRMDSQNLMTDQERRDIEESSPVRKKEYEAKLGQYQIQKKHYEEYVKRLKDEFAPPIMPRSPVKPLSPKVSDDMREKVIEFREQQSKYFNSTSKLNWISCLAALSLVGGLLYLLMFDLEGKRIFLSRSHCTELCFHDRTFFPLINERTCRILTSTTRNTNDGLTLLTMLLFRIVLSIFARA